MREEISRLRQLVADQAALLAKQQARIEILERMLGTGPGGPPVAAAVPPQEPAATPKPRGRPPGHPGAAWSIPAVEPAVVRLRLAGCPDCGGRLTVARSFQEHTVVDLPEKIEPVVTTFVHERRYCPRCKKTVRAPRAADEPPKGHYGLRVLSLISDLKTKVGMPFTKMHGVLANVFGITIPRSTLPGMVQRVGQWLVPVHQKLIEAVGTAAVVHADETTWRVSGKNGWAWLFATKEISAFVMEPTRAGAVARKILRKRKGGVLVADDYCGYRRVEREHQSCWAHLLREAKEAAAATGKAVARRFRRRLQHVFHEAEIVAAASESLSPSVYEEEIRRIDRMLMNLCKGRSNVAAVEHLKNRITRQRRPLLTFLRRPGVEPTNNLGERKIRQLVVARKISGGSRSWAGARAHGVIASCIDSVGHLKKSVIELIREHAVPAGRRRQLVSCLPA